MTSWDAWLEHLLCKLFLGLGRNCTGLAGPIPEAVTTFHSAALAEGRPDFPNPADAAEFDAWLDALETHLDLPDNTLTVAQDTLLRQAISVLRGNQP